MFRAVLHFPVSDDLMTVTLIQASPLAHNGQFGMLIDLRQSR